MTIKDKIKAVILNVKGNFAAGAVLYSQLGDNDSLKQVFSREAKKAKPLDRRVSKLEHCLKQILKNLPEDKKQLPEDDFQPKIIVQTQTVAPEYKKSNRIPSDAPAPIHTLYQRYIKLAKEEASLHGRLFPDLGIPDEVCADICGQIMTIKHQQDAIWDDIRAWENTGEIPVVTTDGFKDGANAYKRLVNLRTRPNRLQKQINNATDETEKAKYQKTLKKVLEEIQYIEAQIKAN